jgi:hypothetical protein
MLADGGAHTEKMPLDDMPESVHFTKLKYSGIRGKCLLPQLMFLSYLCAKLKRERFRSIWVSPICIDSQSLTNELEVLLKISSVKSVLWFSI